jgi:hypothetical protein
MPIGCAELLQAESHYQISAGSSRVKHLHLSFPTALLLQAQLPVAAVLWNIAGNKTFGFLVWCCCAMFSGESN